MSTKSTSSYSSASVTGKGGGAPGRAGGSAAVAAKRKQDVTYSIVLIVALLTLLGALGYLTLNEQNGWARGCIEDKQNEDRSASYGADIGVIADNGVVSIDDSVELITESKEIIPKLRGLHDENPDTVGWIKVADTQIDYVVMQRPVEDEAVYFSGANGGDVSEEYYLHKTFSGEYSKDGSIFAFFSNKFDQSGTSRNTLLFGHHMRSGRMFQNLMNYDAMTYSVGAPRPRQSGLDFYKQNPIILFDSLYEEGRWVIFSVMKADPTARATEFNWMFVEELTDDQQQAFIDEVRARSVIDTRSVIDVDVDDKLLILQTCSYEVNNKPMRTLVIARRLRDGETTIDVSGAQIASNPVFPEIMKRALGYR